MTPEEKTFELIVNYLHHRSDEAQFEAFADAVQLLNSVNFTIVIHHTEEVLRALTEEGSLNKPCECGNCDYTQGENAQYWLAEAKAFEEFIEKRRELKENEDARRKEAS